MVEKHLILGLLWVVFCVLHSWLASLRVKRWLAMKLGDSYRHYRLLYTLFAFATLGGVLYYQVGLASPLLYTPTLFTQVAGVVLGAAGLLIMGICIKKYFLSLSGLRSLFQDSPSHTLMVGGIHRYVRHPLYTGTFMAIWGGFILLPFWSLLIAVTIITVYTLIGIKLEEAKLVVEFGDAYRNYQQQVPKLFPALWPRHDRHLSTPK